jgi:hypothetical protein
MPIVPATQEVEERPLELKSDIGDILEIPEKYF